jgi:hypothetical protein
VSADQMRPGHDFFLVVAAYRHFHWHSRRVPRRGSNALLMWKTNEKVLSEWRGLAASGNRQMGSRFDGEFAAEGVATMIARIAGEYFPSLSLQVTGNHLHVAGGAKLHNPQCSPRARPLKSETIK